MKTQCSVIAVALLIIASVQFTPGQTIQGSLYDDLGKSYGFIVGQRITLNRIKKEYPDLTIPTQKAELQFQIAFGNAERNMIAALQEILGTEYPEFVTKLSNQLETLLSTQPLNQTLATNFLAEVELRANGTIPSPYLETLLMYQFRERPAEELARGHTRVFRTKGHPKAKGVDFQISYPTSWRPAEGVRPNIIQKFVSENGRGLESIMLMVREIPLPSGYKATRKELDEFFKDIDLSWLIPAGARVISRKPIVLDGQSGLMVIFDEAVQRMDVSVKFRSLTFVTVWGNKLIIIQCMASPPLGKETEMQQRFNRIEPLFKWVGNSFVLQEQYR